MSKICAKEKSMMAVDEISTKPAFTIWAHLMAIDVKNLVLVSHTSKLINWRVYYLSFSSFHSKREYFSLFIETLTCQIFFEFREYRASFKVVSWAFLIADSSSTRNSRHRINFQKQTTASIDNKNLAQRRTVLPHFREQKVL